MVDSELVLKGSPGKRFLLLGNEAIARGVLEAGVGVITTYPGTPSSEIADLISAVAQEAGVYMEYSTNEIVAVETAAGAAICGVRALSAMKHVGLNVAADAFMTLAYVGVRGGFTIVTADDPNCYSSQNEQDNRFYALLANVPCLEPSNPQEAKDMVSYSMDISEKLELPCLLRTTTRISHTRGPVVFGPLKRPKLSGEFVRDVKRFVMVPANARIQHRVLLEKMKLAKRISEESPFNKTVHSGSEIGIISSGSAYNYAVEAIDFLNVDVDLLKLGMTSPLPERKIADFMKAHDQIVVLEELEPYLEMQIKAMAKDHAPEVKIHGKTTTNQFPRFGELSTQLVVEGLAKVLGKAVPIDFKSIDEKYAKVSESIPPRPPILCPGCPHRASFYVIKTVTKNRVVCTTDIGCYALGIQPPLHIGDILICMGASVGTACGIGKAMGENVVAVVGDSTFFHAAIPGLINAVYNNHNITLVVLDNLTTAMTGFQPHPGTGKTGMGLPSKKILIEDIARACGVEYVRVVDPFNIKEAIRILKEAIKTSGTSLVVFRQPCALLALREKRRRGEKVIPCNIVEKCTNCQVCVKAFGCPALYIKDERVFVNEALCTGCMVCATICPYDAIEVGA